MQWLYGVGMSTLTTVLFAKTASMKRALIAKLTRATHPRAALFPGEPATMPTTLTALRDGPTRRKTPVLCARKTGI